ncbi:MAG: sigma-70 family RNA polymerase sigma factor [Bacteroidales bacterium]|nr:sigma-70 family RNA polymerase sigma factor [Bacteroidales bacterium]
MYGKSRLNNKMARDSKYNKAHIDDDTIRILDNLRPKLISVAFDAVRDFYQADEYVQEVVERLWLSRKTIGNIENIEAYAVTMLKRNIAKYYKSKKKTSDMFKDISDYENIEINDDCNDRETMCIVVEDAVKMLKQPMQNIVYMHYMGGATVAQIAATLGLSKGKVKKEISKALEILKEIITLKKEEL